MNRTGPTEHLVDQQDFGKMYKARKSNYMGNKQVVKLDGAIAIAISMLAFGGVLIMAILMPEIIESRAQEAGARAVAKAEYAERDARVAIDKVGYLQIAMEKSGINVESKH